MAFEGASRESEKIQRKYNTEQRGKHPHMFGVITWKELLNGIFWVVFEIGFILGFYYFTISPISAGLVLIGFLVISSIFWWLDVRKKSTIERMKTLRLALIELILTVIIGVVWIVWHALM